MNRKLAIADFDRRNLTHLSLAFALFDDVFDAGEFGQVHWGLILDLIDGG